MKSNFFESIPARIGPTRHRALFHPDLGPTHGPAHPIARDGGLGVPTAMAPSPPNPPLLFHPGLLLTRQRRAQRIGPAPFLLDRVAEDLEERVGSVLRDFADVADIWTPGEALRKPARDRFRSVAHLAPGDGEGEALPLQPESLDLAVSALAFQFVNDLPGVLTQIRRALRPDGLLLAAMIGGDTLTELRQSFD